MSDDLHRETDESRIPTKELLRRQRKQAYEKAKAKAKAERLEERRAKEEERQREREARDRELLGLFKPAAKLEKP